MKHKNEYKCVFPPPLLFFFFFSVSFVFFFFFFFFFFYLFPFVFQLLAGGGREVRGDHLHRLSREIRRPAARHPRQASRHPRPSIPRGVRTALRQLREGPHTLGATDESHH